MALIELINDSIRQQTSRLVLSGEDGNTIMLNVTEAFDTSHTASVTTHAVEKGIPAADHVIQEPFTVAISGTLTEEKTLRSLMIKPIDDRMYILRLWKKEATILTAEYLDEKTDSVILTGLMEEAKRGRKPFVHKNIRLDLTEIKIAGAEILADVKDKGRVELASDATAG
jgi:hypothetical protein